MVDTIKDMKYFGMALIIRKHETADRNKNNQKKKSE